MLVSGIHPSQVASKKAAVTSLLDAAQKKKDCYVQTVLPAVRECIAALNTYEEDVTDFHNFPELVRQMILNGQAVNKPFIAPEQFEKEFDYWAGHIEHHTHIELERIRKSRDTLSQYAEAIDAFANCDIATTSVSQINKTLMALFYQGIELFTTPTKTFLHREDTALTKLGWILTPEDSYNRKSPNRDGPITRIVPLMFQWLYIGEGEKTCGLTKTEYDVVYLRDQGDINADIRKVAPTFAASDAFPKLEKMFQAVREQTPSQPAIHNSKKALRNIVESNIPSIGREEWDIARRGLVDREGDILPIYDEPPFREGFTRPSPIAETGENQGTPAKTVSGNRGRDGVATIRHMQGLS